MKNQYIAELRIKTGNDKKYIKIMDKNIKYKRGSIEVKYGNGILIKISAQDPTALIASLGSVVKQIKIIGSVSKTMKGIRDNDINLAEK